MREPIVVYDWIRATRETMLTFVESIRRDDLTREMPDVGHGSVRGILVHVVQSSRWWLHAFPKGLPMPALVPTDYPVVASIRAAFRDLDGEVARFLETYASNFDAVVSVPVPWDRKPFTATPRWLYTHATTHEFHHKGQVAMLSRRLGYLPVDTDLAHPGSFG